MDDKDKAQQDKDKLDQEGLDKLLQLIGGNVSARQSVIQLVQNIGTQILNVANSENLKKAAEWLGGLLKDHATEMANAVVANTAAAGELPATEADKKRLEEAKIENELAAKAAAKAEARPDKAEAKPAEHKPEPAHTARR